MWGRRRSWGGVPAKVCKYGDSSRVRWSRVERKLLRGFLVTTEVACGLFKTYIKKMKFVGRAADTNCKKQDVAFKP